MHNDIFYMQLALEQAKQAQTLDEVPVGAIAVLNNEIIGRGYNCPISTQDPTAHAEIIALRQAATAIKNYRLLDVTLYVTLEPCMMCVGAMLHARIKRLVFGTKDPKTGVVTSVMQLLEHPSLNHKITYESGILATECSKLLSDFFAGKRR
jgi:tRNA(adenine34) deaminase